MNTPAKFPEWDGFTYRCGDCGRPREADDEGRYLECRVCDPYGENDATVLRGPAEAALLNLSDERRRNIATLFASKPGAEDGLAVYAAEVLRRPAPVGTMRAAYEHFRERDQ